MTLPFTESADWSEIWLSFVQTNHLNEQQANQFKSYLSLLLEWNERFNITAITDPQKIVLDHFQDSLALTQFIDRSMIKGIADIGSGGGFPGIPLKIVLPDMPVVLIEVNSKKR